MSIDRFFFIVPHYPPHISGLGIYTLNFAKSLLLQGKKVIIVTSNLDDSPFIKNEDGVIVYRLASISVGNGRFPIAYSFIELIKIYRLFSGKTNTLCIIQTRLFFISLIGAFLCFISGVKAIVIEHGSGKLSYKNQFLSSIFHAYEHLNTLIIALLCKPKWYGVSKLSCKWLHHFAISSESTIPNGFFMEKSNKTHGVPCQNIDKSKKIILYASRLLKEKGIIELIYAFKKFSINHAEYLLLIAGSGELEKQVAKMVQSSENMLLLGALAHKDVIGILNHSSLLIHPSRYMEGLPTIVLEAASLGVPVMATTNGLEKIMINGETGMVIPEVESEIICKSLQYFHDHPDRIDYMRENISKLVQKYYNWNEITANFLNDINKVKAL